MTAGKRNVSHPQWCCLVERLSELISLKSSPYAALPPTWARVRRCIRALVRSLAGRAVPTNRRLYRCASKANACECPRGVVLSPCWSVNGARNQEIPMIGHCQAPSLRRTGKRRLGAATGCNLRLRPGVYAISVTLVSAVWSGHDPFTALAALLPFAMES